MWDRKSQGEGRIVTLYGIMEGLTDKVAFEQIYEEIEPCRYLGCDILNPQNFAACSSKGRVYFLTPLNLGWPYILLSLSAKGDTKFQILGLKRPCSFYLCPLGMLLVPCKDWARMSNYGRPRLERVGQPTASTKVWNVWERSFRCFGSSQAANRLQACEWAQVRPTEEPSS